MVILALCILAATGAFAQSIEGLWHATVLNPSGEAVAFQLEITGSTKRLQASLRNGPDRNDSTSASFAGGRLRVDFDYWDATLEAVLKGGRFTGEIKRTYRKTTLTRAFAAQQKPFTTAKAKPVVNVQGDWLVRTEDPKGKKDVYQAVLKQHGNRVEGTLLNVTGDSGAMTGSMDGDVLTLSRFDGIRATLLRLKWNADGTFSGKMNSTDTATAQRLTAKHAEAFDPGAFTRVREPAIPLKMSFPDLEGKVVSLEDERYRGKVVLITIMGSWCPNCHDETPVLSELYERYAKRGFEVIAVAFEYTGDAPRDIRQLKVFVDKFKVKYPVLYAGATEDAVSKLSQLENFGAYPTTLLIGTDGLVKKVHAGFDGPATGERFTALKHEMTELIEALLTR